MKNPKFIKKSRNEEDYAISLKELNISDFMKNDWDTIYEDSASINFYYIQKNKLIDFTEEEKKNDEYFLRLIELDPKIILDYNSFKPNSSSMAELFSNYKKYTKNIILFHNEDKYFKFNLLNGLEFYYSLGHFGYLYIIINF